LKKFPERGGTGSTPTSNHTVRQRGENGEKFKTLFTWERPSGGRKKKERHGTSRGKKGSVPRCYSHRRRRSMRAWKGGDLTPVFLGHKRSHEGVRGLKKRKKRNLLWKRVKKQTSGRGTSRQAPDHKHLPQGTGGKKEGGVSSLQHGWGENTGVNGETTFSPARTK